MICCRGDPTHVKLDSHRARMENRIPAKPGRSAANELHAMAVTWAVAAILPLPIVAVTGPAGSGDVSCLYLGLASGWLVVEFHRSGRLPESSAAWRARTLAVVTAVAVNVALFISFGCAAGLCVLLPFTLMYVHSAVTLLHHRS